jgi:hypothetical protein
MTTATKKRVTNAQMNWMFSKGFAWYAPGQGDWRDPIYTSENEYYWIPEHINRDREIVGGYYEAT